MRAWDYATGDQEPRSRHERCAACSAASASGVTDDADLVADSSSGRCWASSMNGFFGRRLRGAVVAQIACGSVGLSPAGLDQAVWDCWACRTARAGSSRWWPLDRRGRLPGRLGTSSLDPLSAVMILVVSGVGLLIHVYSIGVHARTTRTSRRFFAYLNLFMFVDADAGAGQQLPAACSWAGRAWGCARTC
ncbi:MAG: hypothetical protein MZV64_27970 [Ignavibacteriales bacterium]|nr:hypothetical protein [Ignavibacteriales bacterium]